MEFLTLKELGIAAKIKKSGQTFEENAKLKASGYAKLSGFYIIADDGGFEIDYLKDQLRPILETISKTGG